HPGERHPDYAPLSLAAYLVGLHLAEVPRWLDQMFLDGRALAASACPPRRDRPLVAPKSPHHSLHRTAMGAHRYDQRHKVARRAASVQDGPVRCGTGLATLCADEAPVLARMDTNIPLASLASG